MAVIRELYIFVKSRRFLYPDENLKKPKSPIIFWKQILATLSCIFWSFMAQFEGRAKSNAPFQECLKNPELSHRAFVCTRLFHLYNLRRELLLSNARATAQ